MTRLLNLRSIRAAIARGERRLAALDGKRTELVGSIEQLRDMLPPELTLADIQAAAIEPQVDPVSVLDSIAQAHRDPGAPPVSLKDIQQGVAELRRRKGGWPPGLSRAKTPCPHSPIPHRHRVDDPSKPTELTCVDIEYPEKATAP